MVIEDPHRVVLSDLPFETEQRVEIVMIAGKPQAVARSLGDIAHPIGVDASPFLDPQPHRSRHSRGSRGCSDRSVRVVIDANVLVSAAFKDKISETIVRFVVARTDFEWVVSQAIVDEYKTVLARSKFGLPIPLLQQGYALLNTVTVIVDVPESFSYPPDPIDAKFLACALRLERSG